MNKIAPGVGLFLFPLFCLGAFSGWFWGVLATIDAVYLLRPWTRAESRVG